MQVLERASLDDKFRQRSVLLLSKICKARGIIPAGYVLRGKICMSQVYHQSVFADVGKGVYSGSTVAIKRLRVDLGGYNRVFKVPSTHSVHPRSYTFT